MLLCANELLLLAAASLPQGLGSGIPPHLAPSMRHPTDLSVAAFAPFTDANGEPARNRIGAAGSVDFDGDGTDELWFLAQSGPNGGEFSIQMPRGTDIGRYRPYAGTMPATQNWTDGATYARTTDRPRVLLVAPGLDRPFRLDLLSTAAPGEDPRTSANWLVSPSSFYPSNGMTYEIEARDFSGVDAPDIYTLVAEAIQGIAHTIVRKETIDPVTGQPNAPLDLLLPTLCNTLRIADFNGDAISDFAVHLPDLGVAVFLDTGNSYVFAGGIPMLDGVLRDLFVSDLDADGKDELGVVVDEGVLHYGFDGPTPETHFLSASPTVLVRPRGLEALATAVVVDAYWDAAPELVMLTQDSESFAMFPYDPVMGGFTAPIVRAPERLTGYQGPGTWGQTAVCADIDADGDQDLVVQTANGTWFTMAGPSESYRPIDVQVFAPSTPTNGHFTDNFTVVLPASWSASGATHLEVSLHNRDIQSIQHSLRWTEDILLAPGANIYTFNVTVRADGLPVNIPALFTSGDTLMSVHLRNGNQRFASQLLHHEGPTGTDGSAVGIRWRLIASPPLSDVDDDLLPWN